MIRFSSLLTSIHSSHTSSDEKKPSSPSEGATKTDKQRMYAPVNLVIGEFVIISSYFHAKELTAKRLVGSVAKPLFVSTGARAAQMALSALSSSPATMAIGAFAGGYLFGTGINYLPQTFGAENTVGDHIGDWMTETFGHPDLNGNFVKTFEWLGLA